MTRLQLLERENKDLKIRLKCAKDKIEILNELHKEDQKKLDEANKKINILFAEIAKMNNRLQDLEEKNKVLEKENERLKEELDGANKTIDKLKTMLAKDSSNSNKPSSTDGFKKKIHNCREKTGRKVGGQIGHKGYTLGLFDEPTQIIEHKNSTCLCGGEIIYKQEYAAKQVVDIEITPKIIEHRAYIGECTNCKKVYKSKFPSDLKSVVEYGNLIKTLTTILVNEGMVSINRTKDIISSISSGKIKLSEGTIVNFNKELSNKAMPIVERIKEYLIKSKVLHVDESGVRINGKMNWLHTTCTDTATYYEMQEKRGFEATEDIGILAKYVGILVHDHLSSYYKYKAIDHSECNVHIIRYLKSVIDVFKREEAQRFLTFLVDTNNKKKVAVEQDNQALSIEDIEEIESEYMSILNDWRSKYYEITKDLTKKRKAYYNDEKCLIERLIEYKNEHLRFIKDFDVPFDNNLAERALRMIKNKTKVSGGFRGKNGGDFFSNIRSIIATSKKMNICVCETIFKIFSGQNVPMLNSS